MDSSTTLVVIGGSVCSFKLLNAIAGLLPIPEAARKKVWKWRNTITSLSHSSLTAAWAVLCLYRQPQMIEDLISSHSLFSHSLVAVSSGYFLHDFVDVGLNQSLQQSCELLLHHSTVISCFSLALMSRLYLGLAVVSLLIEINSVFLHIRQLLLLSGRGNREGTAALTSRPSVAYRLTTWLNLGTLLVFRVGTMAWMTRWLAANSGNVPRLVLLMGTVGMSLISVMNLVLFYRLFRADILHSKSSTSESH